ncbi:MAG: hypothetical protein O6929_11290 [candidate division NC10 bacterium]|nr:hypothetical protein [candidate division NC10 bacterium]
MDLQTALPVLLPKAIAWAEGRAAEVVRSGRALNEHELELARGVGVAHPERIRIMLVNGLPMPEDPLLQAAALQTGLLGPGMVGLTLGYSVFICRGNETVLLLSHEFRHVYQYEQAGSIAAFLPGYLQQIAAFGYADAPLEHDARAHERAGS